MPARLGPRFALEAAFLILLAVALGIADLGVTTIVAVMAAGWLLVSLIELVASREPRFPPRAERVMVEEPAVPEPEDVPPAPEPVAEAAAPVVVAEEEEEEAVAAVPPEGRRRWFRRRAASAPTEEPEAAEATVEPAPAEPDARVEERSDAGEQAAADESSAASEPRRRRRWFRRREEGAEAEADSVDDGPLPPRHVRRIEPDEDSSRAGESEAVGDPDPDPVAADEALSAEVGEERERQAR